MTEHGRSPAALTELSVPEQTVETVREDVEMAKQRAQEGRR